MIITVGQVSAALLICARIMGLMIEAPLFSSRNFPASAKVALAIWIAIAFWFVVPIHQPLPSSALQFVLALISEVVLGFLLGLICNIFLLAVQSAGEIMDLQMGLSVATALDPVFGSVISIIGKLALFLGLILFISFDGHHMLLAGLHQSFTAIPAGAPFNLFNGALTQQLIELGQQLWMITIQLSAPVVLIIFISDFAFGIVSRVAPQVNVFMLGFQVKPALGLLALLFSLPLFIKYVGNLIETMGEEIVKLMLILK
jgi:flagellar biosynthetic protein FliR